MGAIMGSSRRRLGRNQRLFVDEIVAYPGRWSCGDLARTYELSYEVSRQALAAMHARGFVIKTKCDDRRGQERFVYYPTDKAKAWVDWYYHESVENDRSEVSNGAFAK